MQALLHPSPFTGTALQSKHRHVAVSGIIQLGNGSRATGAPSNTVICWLHTRGLHSPPYGFFTSANRVVLSTWAGKCPHISDVYKWLCANGVFFYIFSGFYLSNPAVMDSPYVQNTSGEVEDIPRGHMNSGLEVLYVICTALICLLTVTFIVSREVL